MSLSLRDFQKLFNSRFPDVVIQYHLPSIHASQGNGVDQKVMVIGRKLLLVGLLEEALKFCLAGKASF